MANYQLDFTGQQINNAIKYQSNYNYLLNSNFKINQRGSTSYSSQCYSVDRWFLGDDLASATQDQNTNLWTFSISGASSASSRILFEQIIENYDDFAGLKVTATIKYSSLTESVSGTTELVIDDGVNTSSVDLDSTKSIASVTHTVNASATTLIYKIQTKATGTNTSIIPKWCKLEIGENSTDNIPRNLSEELWLCQRYYQKVILDGQSAPYATALNVQPLITLANTMREQPTMTAITYPKIYGVDTNGTATSYESIQFTFKKMKNNLLSVLLKTGNNGSTLNFTRYDFYCLKNGEMALDAEIYPVTTYSITAKGTSNTIYFNYGKTISSTEYSGVLASNASGSSTNSTTIGNSIKYISFYSATPFTSGATSGSISVSATSGTVSVTEGANTCMLTLNNAASTVTFTLN